MYASMVTPHIMVVTATILSTSVTGTMSPYPVVVTLKNIGDVGLGVREKVREFCYCTQILSNFYSIMILSVWLPLSLTNIHSRDTIRACRRDKMIGCGLVRI